MRTVAYVDGYNLYYGRLRHTTYKWLDLRKLLAEIIHVQEPGSDLTKVVFCTAAVKPSLATHGQSSLEAQTSYHRALTALGVEVIAGTHSVEKADMPSVLPGQKGPDKKHRSKVWRIEEKKTDVNIALGLYRDAISRNFDQVVLVTSDTDLVPALEAIKSDAPDVRRGVIQPKRPKGGRPPTKSLSDLAHWARGHITDAELEAARLKPRIGTKGKPAEKPEHW